MPISPPGLESVDAKMIRAHENIGIIAREINDWFSTIRMNMYLKTAPDQPWPWLVLMANDYIPPVRLSVLVGECVHNMRSAVDNLVCALARITEPACRCHGLAFPLFKDIDEWNAKSGKSLKGVPPAAKDIIRQLQPWSDASGPNPLGILNKLSNIDKHRACNFTLPYNRDAVFLIHCQDGTVLQVPADNPLYLGDVQTFTLPIDKRLVEPSARVQASGTLVLTFQEESGWDDVPVAQVLENCFEYVERNVIARLKPFFEAGRTPHDIKNAA